MVALDDLQWADRTGAFIVRTLIPRLAGLPVVWVLASRSDDERAAWFGSDPIRVERLRLGALDTADILAVAQDALGRAPDARMMTFLAAVEGNPLHAGRIVDDLVRAAERGDSDTLPASFAASVTVQLDALPAPARELVETVAAAGRPLPLSDASGVLDDRPMAGVAAAVESGVVIVGSDHSLAFRHDLVREVV